MKKKSLIGEGERESYIETGCLKAGPRELEQWGPAYARKMPETDERKGTTGRRVLRHF